MANPIEDARSRWLKRATSTKSPSKREMQRIIEKMEREMKTLMGRIAPEPKLHGQPIHWSSETWDYGGVARWYCTTGFWVSEGLIMTEAGTPVTDFDPASIHLPKDCDK